jgi:HK97 family phage portal protein
MNRLGRALRYVTDAVTYAGQSFKQSVNPVLRHILWDSTRMSGSSTGEDADVDFYLRLAATNPAVFGAVTTIADRINNSEFFTVERNDGNNEWSEIKHHPFITVLSRPNSIMSGSLLLSDAAWWYELLGNAYWFVVTDQPGFGEIREIWPLPADRVQPDPTTLRLSPITGKPILDYQYTLGSLIKLPGENVIHFRTANPFDPWRGLSKLSPLKENMRTSNAIFRWLGSFYEKGNAIPASIISLPPMLSDEDFEMVKQDIQDQFGGKRQTAVSRAGDLKVEVIGHSSTDMQVVEHQRFNKQEVREVFRIPDGLTSASSGQARLAAETALARDAIQPLLDYFAETFTIFALRFYERKSGDLRCKAKNVIPQDRALEVSEHKTYGADRTLNENRKVRGLPPLHFTGALAQAQQLLDEVPLGLMPIIAPLIVQKPAPAAPAAQPPVAPPTARPADALLGALVGNQSTQWRVAEKPQLPEFSQAQGDAPSYRVSGMPAAIDPIEEMLGGQKSVNPIEGLSAHERDALIYALFNQYASAAHPSADSQKSILLDTMLDALKEAA